MLKHIEILDKMSAKQKISLVADLHCLADEEYAEIGIPRMKFVTLEALFAKEEDGLTPYTLARSWDMQWISQVTEKIIERNGGDANVIIVPSPKINLGAEAQIALSEDPFLASEIVLAFLSAVKKCNKIGVISDFFLTGKEVANMDLVPNERALHDFLYEPFSSVVKRGKAKAVIGTLSKNNGAYEDFNRDLIRQKERFFSRETEMLCICRTYDETIAALEQDCIIFKGVEIAIQNAYDEYLSISSAIEMGRASMMNLEEAFEHKTAISDPMLDAAADKVIDFAFRMQEWIGEVNGAAESAERNEEYEVLLTRAIEKSTVLLKNDSKVLPAKKVKSFAIIGDAAMVTRKGEETSFAEYFAEFAPDHCIGMARGYDLLEDRSDQLISDAVALADQASMVFVFLKARESDAASYPGLYLPANQTALISALSACKCNVVAVLSTEKNVDVSFGEYTDALVLSPIAGRLSALALANTIFGKESMGGKLTTTFYEVPSKFYKKQRFYKDTARNKVGIFTGYRSYDTQDMPISYPFGYGLKYSDIEISNPMSSSNGIAFTVTNTGNSAIDETVEIYTGKEDSKLLRPKKELKAFCTLHLKAKKSQTIEISDPDLRIYDENTKASVVENGQYTISFGTSVSCIKATMQEHVSGIEITADPPRLSDYLQAHTNIVSNNFTLEAKHEKMMNYKTLKNAGLITFFVAIIVGIMAVISDFSVIPTAVGAIVLFISFIFFGASNNLKSKVKLQEEELIKKNSEMFQNANSTTAEKLEDLFLQEFKFDVADAADMVREIEEVYVDTNVAMLNEGMSFALAASDFKKSAEEYGVAVDSVCAASIIASFVCSKLIIAKNAERDSFDTFVSAVANYFGANLFTETITEAHNPDERLLRVAGENGALVSTAVLNALISAEENPQVMHMIHLKNLPTSAISDFLLPYVKYLSNPLSGVKISAKNSTETYAIPSNVWFITELEQGSLVENVPAYILEYATLLPLKFEVCQPAAEKSEFVPITLTDFEFLSERCRAQFMLNEDVWKKIDAIEAFAFKHASYKIGNKLWLRIENYVAALLSAGTELPIAIDSALASVILPTLSSVLVGKLEGTEKTLIDETERVFGEDNVQISHKMLVSKA